MKTGSEKSKHGDLHCIDLAAFIHETLAVNTIVIPNTPIFDGVLGVYKASNKSNHIHIHT